MVSLEILEIVLYYIDNFYTLVSLFRVYPELQDYIPENFTLDFSIDPLFIFNNLHCFNNVKKIMINGTSTKSRLVFNRLEDLTLKKVPNSFTKNIIDIHENLKIVSLDGCKVPDSLFLKRLTNLTLKSVHIYRDFKVPETLRYLSVISSYIEDLGEKVCEIPLTYLHIEYSIVFFDKKLRDLKSLTSLFLDSKCDFSLQDIASLTLLESLSICSHLITDDLLVHLVNLREFSFLCCDVSNISIDIPSLKKVEYSTSIERSFFPNVVSINCRYEIETLEWVIPQLESLKIFSIASPVFNAPRVFANLKTLELDGFIVDENVLHLDFFPKLKVLKIKNCNANVSPSLLLEELEISYWHFDIKNIENMSTLKVLSITCGFPSYTWPKSFITIEKNFFKNLVKLENLYLERVHIVNKSIKFLVNKPIKSLSIRHCENFNYWSMKYIQKIKSLTYFDLTGTCITEKEKNIIRYKHHIVIPFEKA